jgi:hypothetical protein
MSNPKVYEVEMFIACVVLYAVIEGIIMLARGVK